MKFLSVFSIICATNTVATAPPPSPTRVDPEECNDLGIVAAQQIAFDFCPFNAASGTSASDEPSYKAICKDVATGICRGAIYSQVQANGCSVTTSELLELQDECGEQIDSMVGTDDGIAACPFIYSPVCGCDGATYDNDCLAEAAGTTVCSQGECPVACPANYAPVCGCDGVTYSNDCLAEAAGTTVCAEGECPVACPYIYSPVCGCDGVTYNNDCLAEAAGTTVCYQGECEYIPPVVEKCSDGYDCESCLSKSGCLWWADLGYCEQGCGMEGCGASKCASEYTTCKSCLGGSGSTASGQYSWSPCDQTCYEDCMWAPADAPCFKAKHHFDPNSGYTPSDCEWISCARESSKEVA